MNDFLLVLAGHSRTQPVTKENDGTINGWMSGWISLLRADDVAPLCAVTVHPRPVPARAPRLRDPARGSRQDDERRDRDDQTHDFVLSCVSIIC